MNTQTILQLGMIRDGLVSRRSFLQVTGSGLVASGWLNALDLQAEDLKKRQAACILVWLGGGPSQFETWDPKIGQRTSGPHMSIPTALTGVRFDEYMPNFARLANRA